MNISEDDYYAYLSRLHEEHDKCKEDAEFHEKEAERLRELAEQHDASSKWLNNSTRRLNSMISCNESNIFLIDDVMNLSETLLQTYIPKDHECDSDCKPHIHVIYTGEVRITIDHTYYRKSHTIMPYSICVAYNMRLTQVTFTRRDESIYIDIKNGPIGYYAILELVDYLMEKYSYKHDIEQAVVYDCNNEEVDPDDYLRYS
jgi:hypothetical protein